MRSKVKLAILALVIVVFAGIALYPSFSGENLPIMKLGGVTSEKMLPSWLHTITLTPSKPLLLSKRKSIVQDLKLEFLQPKYNTSSPNLFLPFAKEPTFEKTGEITLHLPNLLPGEYQIVLSGQKLSFHIQNYSTPSTIIEPNPEKCLKGERGMLISCLENYFNPKIHDLNSAHQSIKELEGLSTKYPAVIEVCHNIAHDLGEETILVTKGDVSFEPGYEFCDAGFYHGLFEGTALYESTAKLGKEIVGLCEKYNMLFATGGCSHSLGHIAYWRTGDFQDAIKLCEIVDKANKDKPVIGADCAGGVTMTYILDYVEREQSISQITFNKPIIPLTITNPFTLCENITLEDLKAGCLSHVWLFYTNGGALPEKYMSLCDKYASTDLEADQCYYGFGQSLSNGSGKNIDNFYSLCLGTKTSSGEIGCFEGLTAYYLNVVLNPDFVAAGCLKMDNKVSVFDKAKYCAKEKEIEAIIIKKGLSNFTPKN